MDPKGSICTLKTEYRNKSRKTSEAGWEGETLTSGRERAGKKGPQEEPRRTACGRNAMRRKVKNPQVKQKRAQGGCLGTKSRRKT